VAPQRRPARTSERRAPARDRIREREERSKEERTKQEKPEPEPEPKDGDGEREEKERDDRETEFDDQDEEGLLGRSRGRRLPLSHSTLTILVVVIVVTAGLWWGLDRLADDDEPTPGPDYLLEVWASSLDRPISVSAGPEGSMFVGQGGSPGEILKLWEDHGNITASQWVTGISSPMGMVWTPTSWLYVSHRGRLSAYQDSNSDGAVDKDVTLIDDLPTNAGIHLNNGLAVGPDGFLYLAVGSSCNACSEKDERSATILRVNPTNGNHTVFATGLRNSLDLALRPTSGDLFAVDNCRTDKEYPEELNLIVKDRDYGWPDSAGGEIPGTTGPDVTFPVQSKPWGLAFTPDHRFTGAAGEAIVGLNDLGKVVKVNLTHDAMNDSYTGRVEDLVTGLESPTDLAFGDDGALYITDSKLGQVFKLTRR